MPKGVQEACLKNPENEKRTYCVCVYIYIHLYMVEPSSDEAECSLKSRQKWNKFYLLMLFLFQNELTLSKDLA
jgi:hypothetical protein